MYKYRCWVAGMYSGKCLALVELDHQPAWSLPSGLVFRPGVSGSQGGATWQRLRRQQGRAGHRVVLSAAVLGRRRVRVVLSVASYTRQRSAVLWVVSVVFVWSCVFWGILKLTATLSPESLWLPFQTASGVHLLARAGARGLCQPRPPSPFSFGAPDAQTCRPYPWDRGTRLLSEQGPSFVGCRLILCSCLSPPSLLRPGLLRPHSGVCHVHPPSPLAVCYCVYTWWWLCWSFFCVYLVLCVWEITVFECTLLRVFWRLRGICHFIGHLFVDCGQLCHHRWDLRKRSFFNFFFILFIYFWQCCVGLCRCAGLFSGAVL